MIVRLLPLIGVTLFLAVGFAWRAWLHHRRHGDWGILLFHSVSRRQRSRDVLFVVLLVTATAQSVAVAAAPGSLAGLHAVPPPSGGAGVAAASCLLLGGVALMVTAQLHLGASWRIGIDERARPGLVTGGLYRLCRNPIFLGMFLMLGGLIALIPTWVSGAILVAAFLCVRSQVIEEEAYLSAAYGEEYREYGRRIGRFVPGMGRLG